MLSGTKIMAIEDEQICSSLQVTCPFVAGYSDNAQYGYRATRGEYEDTVMFINDGPGMKLVSISNGETPTVQWNQNWYFGAGECVKH